MNKKSYAILLIIGASILGGVLILSELQSRPQGSKGVCQIQLKKEMEPFWQPVWVDGQYIVAFNSSTQSISLLHWGIANGELTYGLNSEAPLACQKATYNCLPQENRTYSIAAFSPPNGILKSEHQDSKLLFPFSWDSQKEVRMGAPLRLCGRTLDLQNLDVMITAKNILVFERTRSLLASYSVTELNGTVLKAAEREPDRIFQVSSDAVLLPGSCDGSRGESSNFRGHSNLDYVLMLSSSGVLRIFDAREGLVPLLKPRSDVTAILEMARDSFTVLMKDGSIQQIDYQGTDLPKSEFRGANVASGEDRYWEARQTIIKVQAPKWLSQTQYTIGDQTLARDDFKFFRSSPTFDIGIGLSKSTWVHLFQAQNQSASFSVISCD